MTDTISRRGFLKSASAAMAVLYVGTAADGVAAASGRAGAFLNPFVKIDSTGRVVAIIKHFEKGQGPATGLSTLIAEELGVTMDQIGYEFAPSDPQVYNNLFFGAFQGTGGSTAMANSWMQYRTAGANAREMLIAAAARDWGVSAAALDIQGGQILGAGNRRHWAISSPRRRRLRRRKTRGCATRRNGRSSATRPPAGWTVRSR